MISELGTDVYGEGATELDAVADLRASMIEYRAMLLEKEAQLSDRLRVHLETLAGLPL